MYSVNFGGKVQDVVFSKRADGSYGCRLGGEFLGLFFKLRRGWSVVIYYPTRQGVLTSVGGFSTRFRALEYLLRATSIWKE